MCSRKCAGRLSSTDLEPRICIGCGKQFTPNAVNQVYCNDVNKRTCSVCGKEFEYVCNIQNEHKQTCSAECTNILRISKYQQSFMKHTKTCEWCGKEFHPVNNTQKYCDGPHYQTCQVCGKQFEVDLDRQKDTKTCSQDCSVKLRFIEGNPFANPETRNKARQTCIERYGVDHPMHDRTFIDKCRDTYMARTGYPHPSWNPKVRSKCVSAARRSKLESRVAELFDQYKIDYVHHHMIRSDMCSHEFDFYIPKYNMLIDCDGVYYHAYIQDPDGKHSLDYYDEDRISLIPARWTFHVIVEGNEDREIKNIVDEISKIDSGVFDYDTQLFTWCRQIGFPYPSYSHDRMVSDYRRLCAYDVTTYNPSARLGDSAISNFHHSIYDAHVRNCCSPKVAWNNDDMLKRVIKNRLIYKNDVDPHKIMKGFNISKICPRVSIFNPVLARYIIYKYMSQFDQVFDPFSGFSGRLIGVSSCNKTYIGQDLNAQAVQESNDLITELGICNSSVIVKDIFQSSGTYDCLITCPPYDDKEVYADETIYKSCDQWIDECLSRFRCRRYAFVVDHTEKYKDYVVEDISASSHFCKVVEHLIVI